MPHQLAYRQLDGGILLKTDISSPYMALDSIQSFSLFVQMLSKLFLLQLSNVFKCCEP